MSSDSCQSSLGTGEIVLSAGAATSMFLSRQKFYRDKHVIVATKPVFCRDKNMLVATNNFLSRQTIFVSTNIIRDKLSLAGAATSIIFVATNMGLSRQKNVFCGDESMLVATKHIFAATKNSCAKLTFVATPLLSRQKFCCGKHTFVATKLSSGQKSYS